MSCRAQNSIEWVLFKVSTVLMMSDYEEDVDDFPTCSTENTSEKRPDLWLVHIAQDQQLDGQLQLESLRKFHHSLTDQLLSSSMRR